MKNQHRPAGRSSGPAKAVHDVVTDNGPPNAFAIDGIFFVGLVFHPVKGGILDQGVDGGITAPALRRNHLDPIPVTAVGGGATDYRVLHPKICRTGILQTDAMSV